MTVQLLLLRHVGEIDQGPGDDARPAVEEQLEVEPFANARVELYAHHVVIKYVPCKLTVKSQTQRIKPSEKSSATIISEVMWKWVVVLTSLQRWWGTGRPLGRQK